MLNTTNAAAMTAAGFNKVRNATGRIEVWVGLGADGSSTETRLFDPATGYFRSVTAEAIDGVQISAAVGGLAMLLLELIADPSLPLTSQRRAALSAAVIDALG